MARALVPQDEVVVVATHPRCRRTWDDLSPEASALGVRRRRGLGARFYGRPTLTEKGAGEPGGRVGREGADVLKGAAGEQYRTPRASPLR